MANLYYEFTVKFRFIENLISPEIFCACCLWKFKPIMLYIVLMYVLNKKKNRKKCKPNERKMCSCSLRKTKL